jgi:uncharacterized membrane protein
MQNNNLNRMVGSAILVALVVVLQIVASFIKFGPFSITLALVPIIIGAVMYGSRTGAVLGGAFGVVVLIMCINGVDIGGHMLWGVNPAATAILCILKGVAAGWGAGLVYASLSKNSKFIGIFSAALICPVINTGIFLAAMPLLFRETLIMWAGDTPLLYYTLVGLTGINFIIELGVNIVLSPTVLRIIAIAGKSKA